MRKLIILAAALMELIFFAGQAQAAYIYEYFENWRNPFLAEGWTGSIHGAVTGGEFNQIYSAGQGISSGGDGTNFRSIYRDIPVTAGVKYVADIYVEANTTNAKGVPDWGNVRMWMQFDEANGKILVPSFQ